MKKFAITAFAVFYGILILSVSAQRSNEWALREAAVLKHASSAQHSHGFAKTEKSETHLSQTKLVETEYVIELPRKVDAGPTPSAQYILLSSSEYHAASGGQSPSSRAPPSR